MKPRVLIAAALAGLAAPCMALAASTGTVPVEGMPQLAFGHPEQGRFLVANVVWLLIIFGVLYFVMAQYALPRVEGVLTERRARIEGDLEQAQAAKQQADAAAHPGEGDDGEAGAERLERGDGSGGIHGKVLSWSG